jgi:plastocyanin
MSLLVLGASLALAAPAVALDRQITFANGNLTYSPNDVTIKTGDTATFTGTNGNDFVAHPLEWTGSERPPTESGSSASFSFSTVGDRTYYCRIHQGLGMTGTLRVVPNLHPATVSFSVSPAPRAGQPVTFTYTGSGDPDGTLTAWKWDLDGDGSFETTTPTGAATTTYATARTVTVGMYAIDDSNEPSATAQQTVTVVAASGGSGGSGSPGSGNSGTTDTTAPRATLVRLRGLKLSFRSSEKASATATLRARGKTIARGSAKAKAGTISIRLRLTSAGRSLLPRGHKLKAKLTLTLRDSAGNRRTMRKTLTVKRP